MGERQWLGAAAGAGVSGGGSLGDITRAGGGAWAAASWPTKQL